MREILNGKNVLILMQILGHVNLLEVLNTIMNLDAKLIS